MILTPLEIPGAFQIDIDPRTDERGSFARTFCREEFARAGIEFPVAQCSLSRSPAAFTLRGMHVQHPPCPEMKLVRCSAGRAWDCLVDLRPESPMFRRWAAAELSGGNGRALLIPERCAHGFLSLEPDTEMFYMMSAPFAPAHAAGVRWDDPAFGIAWPAEPRVLSERDRAWPDFGG